ncbi:MAG: D-sedoheptulose 7-phosphate isomerase [Betaproteobacteria bacterium]|nr:D-sedoheptulose 7-phosphate isomerase [Betaproteobacteria bacterium]
MKQRIRSGMQQTARVLRDMLADDKLAATVEAVSGACVSALRGGNKLLFMGNGGSAADAQHLAGEMVSRFAYDRPGLPAFALTTDSSVLTAIGNDYGYQHLFSRQVEAVGRAGDVLFGISTSGRSPNVLAGLEAGHRMGLVTVGMTGNRRERITGIVDHCIEIPSECTPNIQEGHIVIGHIICGLIEQQVFPRSP